MKIILSKRSEDVHASLEGNPGVWATGRTQYEAVGDLITHHSEYFGIELEVMGPGYILGLRIEQFFTRERCEQYLGFWAAMQRLPFRRPSIRTIADLALAGKADLLKARDIGEGRLRLIEQLLKSEDITLND